MTVHAQQLYSAAQAHLREAERLRKKNIPFALLFLLLALAAPAWLLSKMALILIHNTNEDISEWLFIGVIVGSIVAILAIHGIFFRGVHIIFREKVVPKMIGLFGEDFHYDVSSGVDSSWGEQSKLLPNFSYWNDKDYVRGQLEGQLIECSRILLKDRGRRMVDPQISISQSVLFKGVFAHLEVAQAIPHPVWIIPREANLKRQFPQLRELEHRQQVSLEHLDDAYQLLTTHPATAQAFFTRSNLHIINRFIDQCRQQGGTKQVRLAWWDNHLCLALKRKHGLFALPWFPFFTNLNSLRFVEKQTGTLEALFDLANAIREWETWRMGEGEDG